MKKTSLLIGFLASVALTATSSAADLTVTFENVTAETGNIMIALYDSEEKFLAPNGAISFGRIPASAQPASFTFSGLKAGNYAISAYHDVNDDGKMAKNMFGAPREPYGMSRDARGVMGPPSYEDAVFTVEENGTSLRIRLD